MRQAQFDVDRSEINRLLNEAITGDAHVRAQASTQLIWILPTLNELANVLRRERHVSEEDVFLVSLRLDTAQHAVREAVAETLAERPTADVSGELARQIQAVALGTCRGGDETCNSVGLALYDSGRYDRNRRPPIEERCVAAVDKAVACRDNAQRQHAIELLWIWATDLAWKTCGDAELALDLATDAITWLLRSCNTGGTEPEFSLSGVEIVNRLSSRLLGGVHKTGCRWPGLIRKSLRARACRREVSLEALLASDDASIEKFITTCADPAELLRSTTQPTGRGVCVGQLQRALLLCHEQIRILNSQSEIGVQGARALALIVRNFERRLEQLRVDTPVIQAVATVVHVPSIEPERAFPALTNCLRVSQEQTIIRRILAVSKDLVACGLTDQKVRVRQDTQQALQEKLAELLRRGRSVDTGRTLRDAQTITAIARFWMDDLETQIAQSPAAPAYRLSALIEWRHRIHLNQDLLRKMQADLGVETSSARKLVTRHLDLLREWGLVEDINDA